MEEGRLYGGADMKFSELGWKQDAILKEFNRVTGKSDVKKAD